MKRIVGTIITVVVGGSVYTISQSDVINNFSANTGLTQQQAEEYVASISEDDLAPFDEIGYYFINDGNDIIGVAEQIDCTNYTYPWETVVLTCQEGKSQLYTIGDDEVNLGEAYINLTKEDADDADISATIPLIDRLNSDFNFQIVVSLLDANTIEESKKINAYNRSLLQTTLESGQE
ncbi:MAG: hypothetical protein NUV84_02155 [Candidatus Uhrbacteria bacterium]|nr:hypothetical protein [Candidatus Uhrbacteria bacterium]